MDTSKKYKQIKRFKKKKKKKPVFLIIDEIILHIRVEFLLTYNFTVYKLFSFPQK